MCVNSTWCSVVLAIKLIALGATLALVTVDYFNVCIIYLFYDLILSEWLSELKGSNAGPGTRRARNGPYHIGCYCFGIKSLFIFH